MRHNSKSIVAQQFGVIQSFLYTTFKLDEGLKPAKNPLTKDYYEFDQDGYLRKHLDIHPLSGAINHYDYITIEKGKEILQQKFLSNQFKEYKFFTKNDNARIILEEKLTARHYLKRTIKYIYNNETLIGKNYINNIGHLYFQYKLTFSPDNLPIHGLLSYLSKDAVLHFTFNENKILLKEVHTWATGKSDSLDFLEFDNFQNWTRQIQRDIFGNQLLIIREIKYYLQ